MKTTAKHTSEWSAWQRFPDPASSDYLHAPFGPGVYELRNRATRKSVYCGKGKNVAYRMSSLIPRPHGAGKRNNTRLQQYVLTHLTDIDYRTLACASGAAAKAREAQIDKRGFLFPT